MNMQLRHAAITGAVAAVCAVSRNAVHYDRDVIKQELKLATARLLREGVCKADKEHYLREVRRLRDILGYAPLPDYNTPDYIRWAQAQRQQG